MPAFLYDFIIKQKLDLEPVLLHGFFSKINIAFLSAVRYNALEITETVILPKEMMRWYLSLESQQRNFGKLLTARMRGR